MSFIVSPKNFLFALPCIRFLNKACIIRNPQEDLTPDGKASDPWSLCTVDQVEDLKALIKVIPIWSTGMLKSVNVSQGSFLVLQASTMNRHITSKFEVPAASFPSIVVLVITTWVVLYDRIIIPLVSKVRGKIVCLNLKQRMGIGILLSTISMAALAIAESFRRATAIKEGFPDNPNAELHISAMWLLPYFVLSGLAEAFNAIGQNEFFYTELPKSMSSVASTLQGLGLSAASLVSSFIVSAVRDFTKGEAQESWVSSNINKGHYDYYYWLLTILSLVNFIYYLVCSKTYGPCRQEKWFNRWLLLVTVQEFLIIACIFFFFFYIVNTLQDMTHVLSIVEELFVFAFQKYFWKNLNFILFFLLQINIFFDIFRLFWCANIKNNF